MARVAIASPMSRAWVRPSAERFGTLPVRQVAEISVVLGEVGPGVPEVDDKAAVAQRRQKIGIRECLIPG